MVDVTTLATIRISAVVYGPGIITKAAPIHYSDTQNLLTHWGRDNMAAIFQTTFSDAFTWMKIYEILKFVPKGSINNIPALGQIMAWRRPGDKPLSEPMMDSLPTHICVTRPQWVNKNMGPYALVFHKIMTFGINEIATNDHCPHNSTTETRTIVMFLFRFTQYDDKLPQCLLRNGLSLAMYSTPDVGNELELNHRPLMRPADCHHGSLWKSSRHSENDYIDCCFWVKYVSYLTISLCRLTWYRKQFHYQYLIFVQ